MRKACRGSLAFPITAAIVASVPSVALAASPFADVPTDSWAYGAVSQLAADGVVQGYGDDTFKGERKITRYEMAQMVAKAIAHQENASATDKATIEKLQAEFASELNNLGVRVANVVKKMDYVHWTGELRFTGDRANYDRPSADDVRNYNVQMRFYPRMKVNDNWMVAAQIRGTWNLSYDTGESSSSDGRIELKELYTQGRYGNTGFRAGKFRFYSEQGILVDNYATAAAFMVNIGKPLHFFAYLGRVSMSGQTLATAFDPVVMFYVNKSRLEYQQSLQSMQRAVVGYQAAIAQARQLPALRNAPDSVVENLVNSRLPATQRQLVDSFNTWAKATEQPTIAKAQPAEVVQGMNYLMTQNESTHRSGEQVAQYNAWANKNHQPTMDQLTAPLWNPRSSVVEELENVSDRATMQGLLNSHGFNLGYDWKKLHLFWEHFGIKGVGPNSVFYNDANGGHHEVYGVGGTYQFNKNWGLAGGWWWNHHWRHKTLEYVDEEMNHSYNLQLTYKNVKPQDRGSFDVYMAYRYLGPATALAPSTDYATPDGAKGIEIGGDYAFDKNVVGKLSFFRGGEVGGYPVEYGGFPGHKKISRVYMRLQYLF